MVKFANIIIGLAIIAYGAWITVKTMDYRQILMYVFICGIFILLGILGIGA